MEAVANIDNSVATPDDLTIVKTTVRRSDNYQVSTFISFLYRYIQIAVNKSFSALVGSFLVDLMMNFLKTAHTSDYLKILHFRGFFYLKIAK